LPVIREKSTGWPYLPGSSVKGVLRDAVATAPGADADIVKDAFGPEAGASPDHAGTLSFTDLKLLALPVRTYAGGFAWVTSPLAMARWVRDGGGAATLMNFPVTPQLDDDSIFLPQGANVAIKTGNTVRLEDLELTAHELPIVLDIANAIAGQALAGPFADMFPSHFGIVSNTTFSFLTRTCTEITARNRIDQGKKIVQGGALWWEEALPAETILAGPIVAFRDQGQKHPAVDLLAAVGAATAATVQLGGNATVGRGLAELFIH
jgi:CRISPR-associated protein Cmr4